MLTSDMTHTARPKRTLAFPEEEGAAVSSPLQEKRRPSDRLFQETMKLSDRLRLAARAAAGEEATGTQREQAQAGGGFRHGRGAAA